jgi:hypothetical protein
LRQCFFHVTEVQQPKVEPRIYSLTIEINYIIMDLGYLNTLFAYDSLLTGQRVWVCQLLPGSREDQLSFVLSEENLDSDALDFTALSYGGTEVGGNVGNREV